MGLQVCLVLSRDGERVLHRNLRLGKALFDVSFTPSVPHEGVGVGVHGPGEADVAVDFGMQDGSAGIKGIQGLENSG